MKIAILFPGYGSQYVGMGKELYDQSRIMQEYFEEADSCLNLNMLKLAFASSDIELSMMQNAYPTQFVVSASIFAILKEEGIVPALMAGYNLGSYAALFAARGISFPDALYLLNKYASLYQEALATLPAIELLRIQGMPTKKLAKMCADLSRNDDLVSIAIINTPTDHIVSGNAGVVDALREKLEDETSLQIHELPREIGLHSALLDALAGQFKMYLEKVDCKDLEIPVLNNAGDQIMASADVKQMIIDLINKPINWHQVLLDLAAYDCIIQVGPGAEIADQVATMYPEKKVLAINKLNDIEQLKKLIKE